jgi:hypothetical protein
MEVIMHLLLILLTALSFPAFAEVYKWTDENGNVHFGSQPPPGKKEEVKIRDTRSSPDYPQAQSSAESDIIRQARELERRRLQQRYESSEDRYRERVAEIREGYDESPDYICTGAENRLKSARERWDAVKMQGYTQGERIRYEQRIRDAQRHRDNVCR